MKDQIITSEDDLEKKLTEVCEIVSGGLLESVFREWTSRLEWVIGHKKEYDIHPR
jgi:hypothetical protein